MSSLMGGESGQAGVGQFRWNDDRINAQWFDHDDWRWVPRDSGWSLVGFSTPWWPGGGGMDASGGEFLSAVWNNQPEVVSGASGFYGFTGITRDVYGTIIGGATVRCFRTSDGLLVSTVTSDATTGAFMAWTPYYPDPHFLVASKTGSPDVAGTSVQTLIAG
jgi:hypothetical protein